MLLVAALIGAATVSAQAGVNVGFSFGLPIVAPAPVVAVAPVAPVVAAPVYGAPAVVVGAPGYVWYPGYWSVGIGGRIWVPGGWRGGYGHYGYGWGHGGGYGWGHGGWHR